MNGRGFSLMEILAVLVIIGVLVSLSISFYGPLAEKGRVSEAKTALMEIRTIWGNYMLEHKDRPATLQQLYSFVRDNEDGDALLRMPASCNEQSYYRYSFDYPRVVAERCSSGGKSPNVAAAKVYRVTLDLNNGSWNGTPGYF